MIYKGKILRVENHKFVKINLDLGFSVFKKHSFYLDGYNVPPELEVRAKSCLVMLLGGRSVVVKPEKKAMAESAIWVAQVYTHDKYNFEDVTEVAGDKRLTSINMVMQKLEQLKYDSQELSKFTCR